MFAGNLIDDLTKTVERAEQRALQIHMQDEELAELCVVAQFEMVPSESILAGVA